MAFCYQTRQSPAPTVGTVEADEAGCVVKFGCQWAWIDAASFSLYTYSLAVALQALTIISMGGIADRVGFGASIVVLNAYCTSHDSPYLPYPSQITPIQKSFPARPRAFPHSVSLSGMLLASCYYWSLYSLCSAQAGLRIHCDSLLVALGRGGRYFPYLSSRGRRKPTHKLF
ncbi:hypothetical protein F5888DRAFT_1732977, partial [Russula emetica]